MNLQDGINVLLWGWLGLAVLMLILWLVQRRNGNAGIVDIGWAGGLGLLAIWFATAVDGVTWRTWLVATLAALWSLRLTVYLARRGGR